eukprot:gene18487-24986_t
MTGAAGQRERSTRASAMSQTSSQTYHADRIKHPDSQNIDPQHSWNTHPSLERFLNPSSKTRGDASRAYSNSLSTPTKQLPNKAASTSGPAHGAKPALQEPLDEQKKGILTRIGAGFPKQQTCTSPAVQLKSARRMSDGVRVSSQSPNPQLLQRRRSNVLFDTAPSDGKLEYLPSPQAVGAPPSAAPRSPARSSTTPRTATSPPAAPRTAALCTAAPPPAPTSWPPCVITISDTESDSEEVSPPPPIHVTSGCHMHKNMLASAWTCTSEHTQQYGQDAHKHEHEHEDKQDRCTSSATEFYGDEVMKFKDAAAPSHAVHNARSQSHRQCNLEDFSGDLSEEDSFLPELNEFHGDMVMCFSQTEAETQWPRGEARPCSTDIDELARGGLTVDDFDDEWELATQADTQESGATTLSPLAATLASGATNLAPGAATLSEAGQVAGPGPAAGPGPEQEVKVPHRVDLAPASAAPPHAAVAVSSSARTTGVDLAPASAAPPHAAVAVASTVGTTGVGLVQKFAAPCRAVHPECKLDFHTIPTDVYERFPFQRDALDFATWCNVVPPAQIQRLKERASERPQYQDRWKFIVEWMQGRPTDDHRQTEDRHDDRQTARRQDRRTDRSTGPTPDSRPTGPTDLQTTDRPDRLTDDSPTYALRRRTGPPRPTAPTDRTIGPTDRRNYRETTGRSLPPRRTYRPTTAYRRTDAAHRPTDRPTVRTTEHRNLSHQTERTDYTTHLPAYPTTDLPTNALRTERTSQQRTQPASERTSQQASEPPARAANQRGERSEPASDEQQGSEANQPATSGANTSCGTSHRARREPAGASNQTASERDKRASKPASERGNQQARERTSHPAEQTIQPGSELNQRRERATEPASERTSHRLARPASERRTSQRGDQPAERCERTASQLANHPARTNSERARRPCQQERTRRSERGTSQPASNNPAKASENQRASGAPGSSERTASERANQPGRAGMRNTDTVKVFSEEYAGRNGYTRRFLTATYKVIRADRPCHLYYDLEFSRASNPGVDGFALVDLVVHLTRRLFRELWQMSLQDAYFVELESVTPSQPGQPIADKFSVHLMVRVPGRAFTDNQAVAAFVNKLRAYPEAQQLMVNKEGSSAADGEGSKAAYPEAKQFMVNKEGSSAADGDGSKACFIDSAVYSKTRHFRMVMSGPGYPVLGNSRSFPAAAPQPQEGPAARRYNPPKPVDVQSADTLETAQVVGSNGNLMIANRQCRGFSATAPLPPVRQFLEALICNVHPHAQDLVLPSSLLPARMAGEPRMAEEPGMKYCSALHPIAIDAVKFVEDLGARRADGLEAQVRSIAYCGAGGTVTYGYKSGWTPMPVEVWHNEELLALIKPKPLDQQPAQAGSEQDAVVPYAGNA